MVICLVRGANLHMAQLMPLPLTVFASVKSRLVLPFWYRLTWVVVDKGPLNGCVYITGQTIDHVLVNSMAYMVVLTELGAAGGNVKTSRRNV